MKKIFLAMAAVVCSISMSAQYVNIYKDGTLVKSYSAAEADSVVFSEKPADTHQYVDLGLPSHTLWATCNVGAEKEEDYGLYFAWGETTGYTADTTDHHIFDWSSYTLCEGTSTTMNKYCTNSKYGTVDGDSVLLAVDDAATANWGSNWCTPTQEQMLEVVNSNYVTKQWITTENGVTGLKITSISNGNSIFLPASGYRGTKISGVTTYGGYWTSSLYGSRSDKAVLLIFSASIGGNGTSNRCYGRPVRAVRVATQK